MTDAIQQPEQITEWTGPPSSSLSRKYRDYTDTANQLRTRPGTWARLSDRTSPSAAYQFALGVRRGRPVAFTAGQFEGAHVGREVYVRYVGDGGANNPEVAEFVEGHVESDTRALNDEARTRMRRARPARVTEMPDTTHLFEF